MARRYFAQCFVAFFLACLISYILQPIVEFCMTRLHIRWRIVAIFMTLIAVGGIIFGLAYMFVPSIVKEIHQMGTLINDYAKRGDPIPLLPKKYPRLSCQPI